MRIQFAAEARTEFAAAARWYTREADAEQASAFRNEMQRIIRLISAHPNMGTPAASGTRRMTAHRYPYDVVYRQEADTPHIIAIAHQRRRPGYWAARR